MGSRNITSSCCFPNSSLRECLLPPPFSFLLLLPGFPLADKISHSPSWTFSTFHLGRETKILAAIARIGYVVGAPSLPSPNSYSRSARVKFLGAMKSVLFVIRAKRASEAWKQQVQARQAVSEALQDVRRRRVIANAPSTSHS